MSHQQDTIYLRGGKVTLCPCGAEIVLGEAPEDDDRPSFDDALQMFVAAAQKIVEAGSPLSSTRSVLRHSKGKRYIRVYRVEVAKDTGYETTDSVYCFVDRNNGDVLKADSWKRPTKHARGSIYTPDNYGVDWHGGKYLR